ncbi:hypothetical protein IPV69_05965 [Humisphaera borealis]|uniref:TM2 domain-containing protein n=2 Tax=Humisphaera borealis TaxID=2807512 RepID=A0A7M2X3Y9_9BACT|nr:hypothetical protein IPV69_05965 [Humisphaera borealis]
MVTNRLSAGICGILFGGLGIHKFLAGFPGAGVTMLLVSVGGVACMFCTFGVSLFATWAMGLIGLIEGILYLAKSDEQFYYDYVLEKRSWF